MPAKSKAQHGMMSADYARAKAGKPTKTGMSMSQLHDFAATKTKGLPKRKGPPRRGRKRGAKSSGHGSPGMETRRYKVT